MSIIGRKILSHRAKSGKRPRGKKSVSFELAKSIGVLYTWEDKAKEEEVRQFVEAISEGRQVQCLCFNPDKKVLPDTTHDVFDSSQLSVLGKIESEATNRFLEKKFHYLFHLDMELDEMCQALLSRSQAQYRVGLHSQEGENFYEMMIGINKNAGLHNFASQILKYVNALK